MIRTGQQRQQQPGRNQRPQRSEHVGRGSRIDEGSPPCFAQITRGERSSPAVSTGKFVGFLSGWTLLMLALLASRTGRLPLIDGANLLFHEAGHPIFAMIHRDLGVYGGTLAQLLIPLICMIAFLRQRAVVSAAVALLWMFQNFFGISAYMADARDQALPMVGGGQHDWTTIFALWGVLEHDREIAAAVRFLAWAGLTATAVGVALLWWRGQQTLRSVETPPPPPKRPAGKNTI